MSATEAFQTVAGYLYANGWWQDGQDPGLWLPGQVTIGDALDVQFGRDGFSPWVWRAAGAAAK